MTLFLLSRLSRVPLGTKTIYWFEWLKHWTLSPPFNVTLFISITLFVYKIIVHTINTHMSVV